MSGLSQALILWEIYRSKLIRHMDRLYGYFLGTVSFHLSTIAMLLICFLVRHLKQGLNANNSNYNTEVRVTSVSYWNEITNVETIRGLLTEMQSCHRSTITNTDVTEGLYRVLCPFNGILAKR